MVLNLISNIAAMLVSLGVSFLLTPLLVNSLGKDAYSFFPLANNFVSYMTILTMALNSMASRFITIEIVKNNRHKAQVYFSSVFYSNVIISILLAIPMIGIVIYINNLLDVPFRLLADVRILFALIFCSMIVNLLSSVFGIATFAKNRMNLYAFQNIATNIVRAILFIVFFAWCPPSLISLGVITLLITIQSGSMQFIFSRKLLPQFTIQKKFYSRLAVCELLKSGIWNSINSLGSILLLSLSLTLANILLGAEAAGNISIVQTLPNFMTTVICTVYGVLLPEISIVYARGNKDNIVETVKLSQKILGIVASTPVVLILLFGKSFFQLWVPNEDANLLHALSVITVLPLLIHSSMWTVYGLNVTNNKLKIPAIVLTVIGGVSVLLTVIGLKKSNLGIFIIPGVSSFFSIVYYSFFIPLYTAKKMNLRLTCFYPHIIRTVLFALIAFLIGYPIVSCLQIDNWISFLLYGTIAEIVGCILYIFVVLTKIDRKKIIIYIVNKKKRGIKK